jgi:hypothetical protein
MGRHEGQVFGGVDGSGHGGQLRGFGLSDVAGLAEAASSSSLWPHRPLHGCGVHGDGGVGV